MRTIVLNQNNIYPDGENNKLIYRFPNSVQFKNTYIAVQSITMYYSWYNVSSALGNNKFSYTYNNSSGAIITYNVVIPDGIYDVYTLNQYLQYTFLQNGTYMTSALGSAVYFMTLEINESAYGVQVCCYQVPSASDNPSAYVASSLGFPTTPNVLIPTFPANFNALIGFPVNWSGADYYGTPTSAGYLNKVQYSWNATTLAVSYLSSSSPQITPNSSIYLSISNINNPYSLPSSIIYAITPSNGIGRVIIDKPPQFCWNKLIDGTYNDLRLTLLGTDFNPIVIRDPNMTILLAFKDGDEWGGK